MLYMQSQPALVLVWADGGCMLDFMQKRPNSCLDNMAVACQIVVGMTYLQDQCIIHGVYILVNHTRLSLRFLQAPVRQGTIYRLVVSS